MGIEYVDEDEVERLLAKGDGTLAVRGRPRKSNATIKPSELPPKKVDSAKARKKHPQDRDILDNKQSESSGPTQGISTQRNTKKNDGASRGSKPLLALHQWFSSILHRK